EADSLNSAILAPDVTPDDEEFDLFIKEVAREMTVKAGQKCTAIRRVLVPKAQVEAVSEKLKARLAKVVAGDPSVEGVRMGALAPHAKCADVRPAIEELKKSSGCLLGRAGNSQPQGEGRDEGAFLEQRLLLCRTAEQDGAAHDFQTLEPVAT